MYRSNARATPIEDEPEPETGEASAEWRVLKAEERSMVREAIGELPQKDKELIQWLFFEERDKDAICRELNIDRDYLRVLFHRAKQRFRERMTVRLAPGEHGAA